MLEKYVMTYKMFHNNGLDVTSHIFYLILIVMFVTLVSLLQPPLLCPENPKWQLCFYSFKKKKPL